MRSAVATLWALTLVLACTGGKAERKDEAITSPAEGVAREAGMETAKTGHAGAISEEAFKALHILEGGEAPAPRGETISLPSGPARAYLSLPEGAGAPLPAVIVIHEWWGLNDHLRHWTDRLAAEGYAALAVDLYDGKVAEAPDEAMKYMKAVDEKAALEALRAASRFLAGDPRVKAERIGVIGWCFGGHWALRTGMEVEGVDAAVMYYGRPVLEPERLSGLPPLLAIFGSEDPSIPPETVSSFEEALTKAGVDHRILRYDAGHAFANPSGANYEAQAAKDAWSKVRAFLAEKL